MDRAEANKAERQKELLVMRGITNNIRPTLEALGFEEQGLDSPSLSEGVPRFSHKEAKMDVQVVDWGKRFGGYTPYFRKAKGFRVRVEIGFKFHRNLATSNPDKLIEKLKAVFQDTLDGARDYTKRERHLIMIKRTTETAATVAYPKHEIIIRDVAYRTAMGKYVTSGFKVVVCERTAIGGAAAELLEIACSLEGKVLRVTKIMPPANDLKMKDVANLFPLL